MKIEKQTYDHDRGTLPFRLWVVLVDVGGWCAVNSVVIVVVVVVVVGGGGIGGVGVGSIDGIGGGGGGISGIGGGGGGCVQDEDETSSVNQCDRHQQQVCFLHVWQGFQCGQKRKDLFFSTIADEEKEIVLIVMVVVCNKKREMNKKKSCIRTRDAPSICKKAAATTATTRSEFTQQVSAE